MSVGMFPIRVAMRSASKAPGTLPAAPAARNRPYRLLGTPQSTVAMMTSTPITSPCKPANAASRVTSSRSERSLTSCLAPSRIEPCAGAGFRALSAEAEQRKARDSDCRRVGDKGEGLGCSEREGPEDRPAEVLGGGLGAAQDPVRMGERAGLDQLRHGRLRGGVVDRLVPRR